MIEFCLENVSAGVCDCWLNHLLNHLASLAKWLSVYVQTKCL